MDQYIMFPEIVSATVKNTFPSFGFFPLMLERKSKNNKVFVTLLKKAFY